MEEKDKKDQGASGSTSETNDTKKFVEIKGEKFMEDPKNPGKALLNDDGDRVPFVPDEGKKEDDIDYKGKLEVAEDLLGKRNESLRKAGLKIQGLENDAKSALTEEKVKVMIAQSKNEVVSIVSEKNAKDMANALTDNPDEAKLILFHYKHSILKVGNLEEDMGNAYAIANKGKVSKTVEEVKRALKAKKLLGAGDGAGEKKEILKEGRPKLTEAEERIVKNSNLVWDAKEKGWKGPSGKIYKHFKRGEGPDIVEGKS